LIYWHLQIRGTVKRAVNEDGHIHVDDIEQAHFARDQRSLMAGANDEGKWRASTCRTRFCSARPASGLTKPFQSLSKRTFDQAIPGTIGKTKRFTAWFQTIPNGSTTG